MSATLLKPAQVQGMLGVSRSWLYAAAQAGRIPSLRLGGPDGPLRFHPDDLEAWVNAEREAYRSAPTQLRSVQ